MKKAIILLFLSTVFFTPFLKAQDVNIAWSEKQLYSNKADGFFDYFIGSNSKFIYAKFHNLAIKRSKADRKMKIVAFDKETMQKAGEVGLIGFKENAKYVSKFDKLVYYKAILLEDIIYVFWTKDVKNKQELWVESFDSQLKLLTPIKKVYELNSDSKSKKRSSLFVMGNRKSDERIIIGGELSGNKDDDIRIEYKLLNKDFSFANSGQVSLPITVAGKSFGLSSDYEFGDDGNLHVESIVTISKEDAKGMSKGENRRYPIFSVIDPASGKIKSHAFKFDKKNIFSMGYKVSGKVMKVYGFFCDLDKDPKGRATHGIMYATLNNETFDVENINFVYFTKSLLDRLFAEDKGDKKKSAVVRSKKRKEKDDEELASDYVIETVQSLDDDNVVLLCSRMRNYTTRTCDSKGNCYTNYYCNKHNVTAFKLAKDGSMLWASNLDRNITYNGWDVFDIKAIHSDNKIYVSYGGGPTIKSKKERKAEAAKAKAQKVSEYFQYAVFDYNTGEYVNKVHSVNANNMKPEDRKVVTNVSVIDNEFVTYSMTIRPNKVPLLVGCGMGIGGAVIETVGFLGTQNYGLVLGGGCISTVGLGVFFAPFYIGNLKHGSGYMGKITPIK